MAFEVDFSGGEYEEIAQYNPNDAVFPLAMARVAWLASDDFNGLALVCSIAPELKERQQAAAKDLGATVLGKPFVRRGSTLVLMPHDKVDQFYEPEARNSIISPADVGNALLQHLFREQNN